MALIIDASYTIAIALRESDSLAAAGVADRIVAEGAIVPALWRFEVANVLLMAVRRGRIAASRPAEILTDLEALPIEIDEAATARAWTATLILAERHGLTVYDAAYLELASRLTLSLATLDGALIDAARNEGVDVIGR